MAEFFGVGRDTVRQEWTTWMPGRTGAWDLREIAKARYERLLQRVGGETIEDKEVLRRTRLAEMLTAEHNERIAKSKADLAQEKLLPADEVEREIVEWCSRISLPLVQLADRISNLMPGELKATIKRIVDSQVSLALREAFESGPLGDSIEDVGSGSSAAGDAARGAASANDDG